MDIYIDRGNLISLFKQKDHRLFPDALKLLKTHLNVQFNFSKEDSLCDDALRMILPQFTQGVAQDWVMKFSPTIYPDRPLKHTLCHTHPDKQSIFLLDDEDIEKCRRPQGLLIGALGEELDTFDRLFIRNGEYGFERKFKIGSSQFTAWQDLAHLMLPFTDLIILDRYLFSDPARFECNYLELLSMLHTEKKVKVNIVVFVDLETRSVEFDEIKSRTRQKVKEVAGKHPNFTMIETYDRRGVKSHAEHDRTIFTNYLRIYSGDSFNYFNPDGTKNTKGREIELSSVAKRENFYLAKDLLNDLQSTIDWLKINNPDSIQGDKVSNFLKFD